MTSDHSPDNVINRRNLLRGGTLAAAGAGAAVLATAAVPRAAFAADGDELLVGEDNEAKLDDVTDPGRHGRKLEPDTHPRERERSRSAPSAPSR